MCHLLLFDYGLKDYRQLLPLMYLNIFLFSILAEESLEISPNVYSGRPNPVWSIARPTDPTKSAKFDKLVTLLMKLVSNVI